MTRSESAGKLARLAVVLGLVFGTLGLAIPAASAARTAGWLRLAHLSPNTPAVDVYLYSFGDPSARVVLRNVSYGTVSDYQRVPTGEYTVAMRMPGAAAKSKPVLSTTVNVAGGDAYTVAGMGPASGLRLQVFRDRLKTPRGKALVRTIQASMHQNAVTVRAGHTVLGRKLKFTTVTQYQAVKPAGRQRRDGVRRHRAPPRRAAAAVARCRPGRAARRRGRGAAAAQPTPSGSACAMT